MKLYQLMDVMDIWQAGYSSLPNIHYAL